MTTPHAARRVTVAIATFRRPDGIAAAASECLRQATALTAASDGRAVADVLVVDNDPDGSARDAMHELGVRYAHEPRPGIAFARNRALAEAAASDAIVFIDDDEVPEPGWLDELVSVYLDSGADAVAGKVITPFPDTTPAWVRASGAFVRPVRQDGQVMQEAASNNLLLDLHSLRTRNITFDERFGLTGGSDSMLTRLLVKNGGTIRWAEDAIVIEREDPKRFERRWVLTRTFRFGNTSARVSLALAPTWAARTVVRGKCVGLGLTRVVGGSLRVLVGTLTASLSRRASGERTVARGLGILAGAVGHAHNEYGKRRASGRI